MKPTERPSPAPAIKAAATGPGKTSAAFQKGIAALAQYIAREGASTPVPRGHSETITVDGETEPMVVKLGVWVSNTRARRDKLTADQRNALAELGVEWA
ncbi:helicase associated domain-containing protein [Streptomyces sp. NBC_01602]|uniref:helicase associated domain-containing protein n=1 Tax=Streptomyces sp. NBC_01602 TaxID=2975893 RepID=UPI0038697D85